MSIHEVRRVLRLVEDAASKGNLKQNVVLFEAVKGALHICQKQLKAGEFEFEDAEFLLEMVLVMHSFKTPIDLGAIGIEALISKAMSSLDRPGRVTNHAYVPYSVCA